MQVKNYIERKNLEKKLHLFKNTCHKNHLKITPQRVTIYKKLISSQEHPSATDIHRKIKNIFPDISLNTINTNLLAFNKIGLINVVEGSGDAKRFDVNLDPHHHFRCLDCNKIIDFYNKDFENIKIAEELIEEFTITDKKLHLEGICDRCKSGYAWFGEDVDNVNYGRSKKRR